MEIVIDAPENFSENQLIQLEELVISGSQVPKDGLMNRIKKAQLIAVCIAQNKIVASAILKNPANSYRTKVFKAAGVDNQASEYSKELGYIVTDKNHRGKKLCQNLLTALMPKINSSNMFATTRKPEMLHVLKKINFQIVGKTYKEDLSLLIFNKQTSS